MASKVWVRIEEQDGAWVAVDTGTDGHSPATGIVVWYASEAERDQKHPELCARLAAAELRRQRKRIDEAAGVSIPEKHAAKAMEASLVLHELVSELQLYRVPHLAAELARQPGRSLNDLATEIWGKYCEGTDAEADRTAAKRALEE